MAAASRLMWPWNCFAIVPPLLACRRRDQDPRARVSRPHLGRVIPGREVAGRRPGPPPRPARSGRPGAGRRHLGPAQDVADLADVAGDHQLHPRPAQVGGEPDQHAGGADVDVGGRLGVQDDRPGPRLGGVGQDGGPDGVGVGEEQPALDPQQRDPRGQLVLGVPLDVAVLAGHARDLAEHGHMGPRGPVQQQQQRHDDPEEQPGQGVEDQHPGQGGHGGQEVGPGGDAVDAAQLAGGDPVQGDQGRQVDQLDDGGDHHRGQGGLGQLLEQAGEEQQGEDGEGGHDQPRHLGAGPGGAVHGRLGEAAVHHHAAGQARAQVGGAEAEQLLVGVHLVVVGGRIAPGRAQALGEADQHDPGRGRGQVEVVGRGHGRGPQGRQPAVDLPDDPDPVGVQVEQPDGGDPGQDRDQRPGHDRGQAPQPQDQGERGQADGQGGQAGLAELGQEVAELLEEVAAAPLDPEQVRELAGDDGQGQPDDEALEHRLGDEAGQEAQAQHPGQDGDEPGGDGQGGGVGHEPGAAGGGDVGRRTARPPGTRPRSRRRPGPRAPAPPTPSARRPGRPAASSSRTRAAR
jgi:hypothetical protein